MDSVRFFGDLILSKVNYFYHCRIVKLCYEKGEDQALKESNQGVAGTLFDPLINTTLTPPNIVPLSEAFLSDFHGCLAQELTLIIYL